MDIIGGASFINEITDAASNMYRLGWDERNSGNISCLLTETEAKSFKDLPVKRRFPTRCNASALAGRLLTVTGAGKYFKNLAALPSENLGVIRIDGSGREAELLWGLDGGGSPTSELPAHIMGHMARLSATGISRIIMHSHPTYTVAMTHIHSLEEREFTHTLWRMCTESILVFPEGVGVLPWMVCGTEELGTATAEKLKEYRIVVWGIHGIYCSGDSMDEAFGLAETVEKAAQIYMLTAPFKRINGISDEGLKALAKQYGVKYKEEFLM